MKTIFETNHLTSFASGYLSESNSIDFTLIFAAPSFKDNMTIFLLLIICYIFYFIVIIWAIVKDIKDLKAVSIPDLKLKIVLSFKAMSNQTNQISTVKSTIHG